MFEKVNVDIKLWKDLRKETIIIKQALKTCTNLGGTKYKVADKNTSNC